MGCYDTVNFHCPSCGAALFEQSKAGGCNLVEYDCSEVPLAVAADLDGVPLECPQCLCKWTVRVSAPPTVPVYLVDEEQYPDD